MVNVESNKNTIFFSLIISLLLYKDSREKSPTKLAKEVFKHYENIYKLKSAQDFITAYKDINPLKVNYQYNILAIFTNNDFRVSIDNGLPILTERCAEFNNHIQIIQNLLPKLSAEMDFDNYYTEEIKEEYEDLVVGIQKIFNENKDFAKNLYDFWQLKNTPKLMFIPNFIATGDCFGVRNKTQFFSISSAKINKESEAREFYPKHVLNNAIHEFSHSFFDVSMEEYNLFVEEEILSEEKFKSKKNSIPEELIKIYGKGYFKECFDRACTLRIKEMNNRNPVEEGYFIDEQERGYLYTEIFYQNLVKNSGESALMVYIDTLKTL